MKNKSGGSQKLLQDLVRGGCACERILVSAKARALLNISLAHVPQSRNSFSLSPITMLFFRLNWTRRAVPACTS
jgi:hypothetical protein